MKVTISFTRAEFAHAQKVQAALLRMFDRCRVHSTQNGDRCISYLTFRF